MNGRASHLDVIVMDAVGGVTKIHRIATCSAKLWPPGPETTWICGLWGAVQVRLTAEGARSG